MKEQIAMVRDFMETFGQVVRNAPPARIPHDEADLRHALAKEENDETVEEGFGFKVVEGTAIHYTFSGQELMPMDKRAVLDGLCDQMYILLGTINAYGFGDVFKEAFDEVHASNMSKRQLDGSVLRREDGKILKGPNYFKPDLSKFIT